MSMCLPSICMSVQTVEVCVHVEMQLQLIYDLNTANTRFTIILSKTKMNQLTSSTTTQLQIKLVSIWERGLLVESQLSEIQNYWEGIRYTTGQDLILDLNFKWHIMIKLKALDG